MVTKNHIKTSKIILYLFLFLGTIIMFFPFVWMLLASFKTNAEIYAYPPKFLPLHLRFGNFKMVWNEIQFSRYFLNSVFVAVVKTALVLYTSMLIGYVIDKIEFKGRNLLFAFILVTMMIPWPVLVIPEYQQMISFKWISTYQALIIPGLPGALSSFGIFLMRQFMHSIPNDIIDSGYIDGAGQFTIFHRLIVPLMPAGMAALGIFTFLYSWEDFLWPYLVMQKMDMYTLPIGIALFTGQYVDNTVGSLTAASVAVIPVIIMFLFFQRKFIEGIAMTGIKG